ncbi:hypothetical protein I7I51_06628 [Histoplasma capsulatum]|uniref:Uncharacterized protein n=1 Tax=Ajellomyces capsulatus TaxID=5037 RepID=A0A8A1MIP6_AJECA|nr:hypothetical protein I7I51_06628 [Histoplasma capsulatum]
MGGRKEDAAQWVFYDRRRICKGQKITWIECDEVGAVTVKKKKWKTIKTAEIAEIKISVASSQAGFTRMRLVDDPDNTEDGHDLSGYHNSFQIELESISLWYKAILLGSVDNLV